MAIKMPKKKLRALLRGKMYLVLSAMAFFGLEALAGTTYLDQCGILDKVNETYVLQNNVSSDGTCFFFSANGITLDLNGHTITYADMDFVGIQNPGFEQENPSDPADAVGWDLSGAHGHAYRQDYTQQLFYDTHSLRIDNIAGDLYLEESVLTSPVYLPLPGRYAMTAEVKGGPYNVLDSRLAIEGIAATCSNTVSNMHLTYSGDMSWDLICEFDVTESATVRGKIIVGTKDETKNTSLNVDEVDIRPIDDNRSPNKWGMAGVRAYGYNLSMTEIKNGSIIEGRSKAIYSSAIKKSSAAKIHDLIIKTNGINSQNIDEFWGGGMEIYNNYMEANGKVPLNRQYPFAMIDLGATQGGNKIYGNTLMNGPHVGISHGSRATTKSEIFGNTIKTRVVATNGFSISAGSNLDVYDNVIQPIQGHGIGLSRDSDNTRIFDNIIEPRTWPCSEYSSYSYPNSAHGIRIKNYAQGIIENLEIYGNDIIGKTNPQLPNCYTEVSGITNYLDDDDSGGLVSQNVKIHSNDISVETDNYMQQHAIAYKAQGQGEIYGNTFKSNHIILDMSDNDVAGASQYKLFKSNRVIKGDNSQGFYTLRYGYNIVGNNSFINTILENGADLKDISFGINGSGATYSSDTLLETRWFLETNVKDKSGNPLAGAFVRFADKEGNVVSEGFSDYRGVFAAEMKEHVFSYRSAALKGYAYASPYQVSVNADEYKSFSFPVQLDSSKSLDVFLSGLGSQEEGSYLEKVITYDPFAGHSGYVIDDFLNVLTKWLTTSQIVDHNSDGIVNTRDLGIVMSGWE